MAERGPINPPPPRNPPPAGHDTPPGGGTRIPPILADPGDRHPRRHPGAPEPPPPVVQDPPPTEDDNNPQSILPSDRATQRTNPDPRSREITRTSPEGEPIPVTFGKARQAGDLIYCETDGISKIYIAISFGWGPINSGYDTELDGFPGSGFGLIIDSGRFTSYLGTPDQPLDPILSEFDPEGWFSALPGMAYDVYVLDLNVEKNQSVNPTNYKKTIEGMLSPDHRVDDTLVTTAYHENPCLALVHTFLDKTWGYGADTTQMNWPSWDEAADDCEVIIETPDDGAPTTAPTVTLDGFGAIEHLKIERWGYTWVYATGLETTISPASSTIGPHTNNYAVDVSDMDVGTASVTRIRLYAQTETNGVWGPWDLVRELNPKQSTYHDPFGDRGFIATTHPPSSDDKQQFRIGLKMATQATMRDWVETFRTLFTAFVAFNNGQYQCFVDKERDETTFIYNEANITGNLEVLTVGIAEIPSFVEVSFTDQDNGFVGDQRAWPDGIEVAVDVMARLERRPFKFNCDGCPGGDQAAHIAKWSWTRGQRAHRIRYRTNQTGILPLPGSIVSVSHVAQDFGLAKLIITSVGPVDDTLGWNIAGEIFSVADYDWSYAPGFTTFPGGGGGIDNPPPPPPPPTPLILRWRVYITDQITPTPPE